MRVRVRVRVAHCLNTYLGEGVHLGVVIDQHFCHVLIAFHGCPHERRHPVLQTNSELEACATLESSACRIRPKRMTLNQKRITVTITI